MKRNDKDENIILQRDEQELLEGDPRKDIQRGTSIRPFVE